MTLVKIGEYWINAEQVTYLEPMTVFEQGTYINFGGDSHKFVKLKGMTPDEVAEKLIEACK